MIYCCIKLLKILLNYFQTKFSMQSISHVIAYNQECFIFANYNSKKIWWFDKDEQVYQKRGCCKSFSKYLCKHFRVLGKKVERKSHRITNIEALESDMCDVIKIRLKGRDETRSRKGNQPLNIKTAVEWPILKLGLTNFRWSF